VGSEDGQVWAVLNGEIYNYLELAERLRSQGHRFRTASDTEVLVHLYEEDGEAMFAELHGMFACAIVDLRQRQVLLARDHAGMKPLFYAESGAGLAFASDIRALFAGGAVRPEADWDQLAEYFGFGYIPAPGCAFRGVRKLVPGSYLRWRSGHSEVIRHWRAPEECFPYEPDAPERLEFLLRQATRSHLQGDVEVGCFLSGGWDSSIVAAMAMEHLGTLRTFSLVMPESPDLNEARHARAVAADLGTQHHEVEFRPAMLPGLLEACAWKLEEPVGSTPYGLVSLLSGLASKHVKAVVGGEGSDELLAGYGWLAPQATYRLNRVVPSWVCRLLAPLAPDARWQRALRQIGAASAEDIDLEFVRGRARVQGVMPAELGRWERTGADAYEMVERQLGVKNGPAGRDRLGKRLLLEFGGRLTGSLLFAADRVSMAEGLEIRLPFLDRNVVEYAMRLPAKWKLNGGQHKAILKPLAAKYAPAVAGRRKVGLQVPHSSFVDAEFRRFCLSVLLDRNSVFPRRELEEKIRRGEKRRPQELYMSLHLLLRLQLWWNAFIAPGSRGASLAGDASLPVDRVQWLQPVD
jgi:asparagine synthase (glutamine-hydrolysing)